MAGPRTIPDDLQQAINKHNEIIEGIRKDVANANDKLNAFNGLLKNYPELQNALSPNDYRTHLATLASINPMVLTLEANELEPANLEMLKAKVATANEALKKDLEKLAALNPILLNIQTVCNEAQNKAVEDAKIAAQNKLNELKVKLQPNDTTGKPEFIYANAMKWVEYIGNNAVRFQSKDGKDLLINSLNNNLELLNTFLDKTPLDDIKLDTPDQRRDFDKKYLEATELLNQLLKDIKDAHELNSTANAAAAAAAPDASESSHSDSSDSASDSSDSASDSSETDDDELPTARPRSHSFPTRVRSNPSAAPVAAATGSAAGRPARPSVPPPLNSPLPPPAAAAPKKSADVANLQKDIDSDLALFSALSKRINASKDSYFPERLSSINQQMVTDRNNAITTLRAIKTALDSVTTDAAYKTKFGNYEAAIKTIKTAHAKLLGPYVKDHFKDYVAEVNRLLMFADKYSAPDPLKEPDKYKELLLELRILQAALEACKMYAASKKDERSEARASDQLKKIELAKIALQKAHGLVHYGTESKVATNEADQKKIIDEYKSRTNSPSGTSATGVIVTPSSTPSRLEKQFTVGFAGLDASNPDTSRVVLNVTDANHGENEYRTICVQKMVNGDKSTEVHLLDKFNDATEFYVASGHPCKMLNPDGIEHVIKDFKTHLIGVLGEQYRSKSIGEIMKAFNDPKESLNIKHPGINLKGYFPDSYADIAITLADIYKLDYEDGRTLKPGQKRITKVDSSHRHALIHHIQTNPEILGDAAPSATTVKKAQEVAKTTREFTKFKP